MLYYIHHLSGNIVIRTNNPYFVLHHHRTGWLSTISFDEVLQDHPEWRPDHLPNSLATIEPLGSMFKRLCGKILGSFSASLAIVPSYSPAGVMEVGSLFSVDDQVVATEGERKHDNTGPLQWMTVVERSWYFEQGESTPKSSWTMCPEGAKPFECRMKCGSLKLSDDLPPSYEWVVGGRAVKEDGGVRVPKT